MQNEFYYAEYEYGAYFFRNKDNAFKFLWQEYLSLCGDLEDKYIQEAFEELNETYAIDGFGSIRVCGFED